MPILPHLACPVSVIVPNMTYNVFGGTLNLALSIYSTTNCYRVTLSLVDVQSVVAVM